MKLPRGLSSHFTFRRSIRFCLLIIFSSLSVKHLQAQSNFIPLEREDIKVVEDRWSFSPGLQLSGDYRMRMSLINNDKLPKKQPGEPDPDEMLLQPDIRLRIRSSMHRLISLNLELETVQEPVNQADIRGNTSDRSQTPDSQVVGIQARQAYLEYNSNPKSVVKLGKQAVNIGDDRGKIFSGILSGISQQCTAKTWCYDAGIMRLTPHPTDMLYYLSLDYPFFHDEEADGTISNSLVFEGFRVLYSERNVPFGQQNHPAFRPENPDEVTKNDIYIRDLNERMIVYDANSQQYFGARLGWETTHWSLLVNGISNQGVRRFHLLPDENGDRKAVALDDSSKLNGHRKARKPIRGGAAEFEMRFHTSQHEFTLLHLRATGDKQLADPDTNGRNYLRGSRAYFEIAPGAYQGTRYYFNGGELNLRGGSGLGHSISNTELSGTRYRITAKETPFFYEIGLYALTRYQPVLNSKGGLVDHIGQELNNLFSWIIDQHLTVDLEVNAFRTGNAFSFSDYSSPPGRVGMITHGVFRVMYSF